MTRVLSLLTLSLWLGLLTACATAAATPREADPDVLQLAAFAEEASLLARQEAAEVLLRQVDSDLESITFRFTDRAATEEIMVVLPGWPAAPREQWTVEGGLLTPLTGHSGPVLELETILVGPERVAQAVAAQWPGCTLRGMTLYRYSQDIGATWVAFCDTPEGTVSGSMDAQAGSFVPSDAPPARMVPVTATPVP